MFISFHFSIFFTPMSMRRFCFLCIVRFDVLWHLSQGQRRSTLDGERRSSRPEISGDGHWQITRFSSSQASAPCTAYGCIWLKAVWIQTMTRRIEDEHTCNIMQSYEHESPTPSGFDFFHFIINKKSESVRCRHCSGKPTQAPAEQESKDSLVLSAWLCPRQLEADLFVIEFCTTLLDAIWLYPYLSVFCWIKYIGAADNGRGSIWMSILVAKLAMSGEPAAANLDGHILQVVPKYHVMCSTCPGHHNIKIYMP